MSSQISNAINSSENKSIPDVFNSFEQCNDALYEIHNIDLNQYCEITHQIQFDTELIEYLPDSKTRWLRSVINIFIEYAQFDVRAFSIPIKLLDSLGFDIEQYTSKIPQWINNILNRYDDNIKKEMRFLKKFKLKNNIDYTLVTGNIEDETIVIGHYITKLTLYKLITKMYGSKFLESIISRMCQILYFFDDYKRVNRIRHIKSLEITINKLTNDIASITSQSPHILKFDNYENDTSNYFLDDDNKNTQDVKVVHHRLTNSTNISDSKCDYRNDDICSIHYMIENSINKVDTRISELHIQLANIMSKIDNIVSSIDFNKRNSSVLSDSSNDFKFDIDDSDEENTPMYNRTHITNKQYSQSFINYSPPKRCSNVRNTCIGNEQQF